MRSLGPASARVTVQQCDLCNQQIVQKTESTHVALFTRGPSDTKDVSHEVLEAIRIHSIVIIIVGWTARW